MKRPGLTLLELLVVLVILVSLSTLVVPMIGPFGSQSQAVSTRENLARLQELIVNRYMTDMHAADGTPELPRPGYRGNQDGRQNHPQLRYLFVNPGPVWTNTATTDSAAETPFASSDTTLLSQRRWNGPYLTHQGAKYKINNGTSPLNATKTIGFSNIYGLGDTVDSSTGEITSPGDPTVFDAWANPIVIQEPTTWDSTMATGADPKKYARLVSAGPNGVLETPETTGMPTASQRGDDIIMFLFVPDQYGVGYVKLGQ